MPQRATLAIYVAAITPQRKALLTRMNFDGWRSLLGLGVTSDDLPGTLLTDEGEGEGEESSAGETGPAPLFYVPARLNKWAANAPFSDLIQWTPPAVDDWERMALEQAPAVDVTDAYTWLWQRNAVNELDRWTTASLHLEYRWQNLQQVGLFSEAALAGDGPSPELLNGVIAQRAVEPGDTSEMDSTFWALQDTAVEYLTHNKFAEAVALFEFHHKRYPNDARAMNNMGFCLMAVSPSKALHWLEKATKYGYPEVTINTFNQCCCLERLNRGAEALDKAEAYWQRERVAHAARGYLWVLTGAEWRLAADRDPVHELATLALRVARDLGRDDRAARWRERLEGLAA